MNKQNQPDKAAGHLEAIANSTTDAMMVIDNKGAVVSWNRAAESIFGHSADEMIGEPLHVIIPERFHQAHDQGIERVNSGGDQHVIGHAVQLAGRRKNGSEFPIELTLSTWNIKGQIHYGGIIRDVSERVKMEDELRNSEARSHSIMETANDAIITADSGGLILSWNPAAASIFGYEPS